MTRKITAWAGGVGGLSLLGWSGFNALQLAGGAAPANTTNLISTILLAIGGAGGISLSSVAMWAQHWALLALAATCISDAESMTLIQKLADRLKNPPTITK